MFKTYSKQVADQIQANVERHLAEGMTTFTCECGKTVVRAAFITGSTCSECALAAHVAKGGNDD